MEGSCDLYVVSTPYHLMIACACCKEEDILVCTNDIHITEVLKNMINASFLHHPYIVESLGFYKKSKVRLICFRWNMYSLKRKIKNWCIDNIFAFNDVDPVVQWILGNIPYKSKCVIIQEGIGLYRDTIKRKKHVFKMFGKVLFGNKFENIDRIAEYSGVDKIICANPTFLSEKQKKKKIEKYTTINYTDLAHKIGIKQYCDCDWFIGQPLVEDGVMKKDEYCGFIKRIIDINYGRKKLVIKPHPREKLDKYNSIKEDVKVILDNNIPVELLIDTKVPSKIFTIYSSAVMNLSKMDRVECVVLAGLYEKNTLIPYDIKRMFEEYSIHIPKTWTELMRG